MNRVTFSANLEEALEGVELIRVYAKASSRDALPAGSLPGLKALFSKRAEMAKCGPRGRLVRLSVDEPDLEWAVLPESPARGLSPSGADFAANLTSMPEQKCVACVVIAASEDEAMPLARAVARRFPMIDRRTPSPLPEDVRVVVVDSRGQEIVMSDLDIAIAEDTRVAARLVDEPPTELNPGRFAEIAHEMLGNLGVEIREIKGDELLSAGCGGIHGVGRCAKSPPRLLIASSNASGTTSAPTIALCGKGVTYDTGGLHLKPRGGMEGMKGDMGGAAAVLGAFHALVRGGHDGPVHAVIPLAENAIGSDAFKPDDILTLHSGQTVEINNTDAEGRLLLADAVSFAARELKADIVFDIATLTGAQLVATGKVFGAIVTPDEELESLSLDVGRETGDPMHPLPYAPELHRKEFESPIADLRNSVKDRGNAQSSCAGDFIGAQIEETDARWCHFDIAGPAWRNDRGTGAGVGLLAGVVLRLQS
ncbi:MAG: leucyl aminopeptidase family protein [Planctomycetota bacterium]